MRSASRVLDRCRTQRFALVWRDDSSSTGKDVVEISLGGEIRNDSIFIAPSLDEKRTRKEQP
jgi:hypothetical protein